MGACEVGICNRLYECVFTLAAATRLWDRADLPGAVTRAGLGTYVDRHNNVHGPAIEGYRLARAWRDLSSTRRRWSERCQGP